MTALVPVDRCVVGYHPSMQSRTGIFRQPLSADRTLRRRLLAWIGAAPAAGRPLGLAVAATVAGAIAPVPGRAQGAPGEAPAARGFKPVLGQEGRDVVWVPTPDAVVLRMLEMAQVRAGDHLTDLGSGDGRIPIVAASRFGARATGVEFSPGMVAVARAAAEKAGVSARVRFIQGDLFAHDFSDATVVTLFLTEGLNLKLRPQLLAMRPGTRVVSHLFGMADWLPDETRRLDERDVHLWIVPAQAGGHWRGRSTATPALPSLAIELRLTQTYQVVDGGALFDGRFMPVDRLALRGDQLSFDWSAAAAGARSRPPAGQSGQAGTPGAPAAPAVPREGRFSGRIAGDRVTGALDTAGQRVPITLERVGVR
jgi:SAM-dependent methyltransferase